MLSGSANQREIGNALFLSINTVKGYPKSLFRKLDVTTRREAVEPARELKTDLECRLLLQFNAAGAPVRQRRGSRRSCAGRRAGR
jgi:Bacterial regulatory proteins, luxR family